MAISTNYSTPVMVNGFSCRNCSEVDRAKKNIDPANPAAGPFGLNAGKSDAAAKTSTVTPVDRAALEQAHKHAAETRGSPIVHAYGAAAASGPFLQQFA